MRGWRVRKESGAVCSATCAMRGNELQLYPRGVGWRQGVKGVVDFSAVQWVAVTVTHADLWLVIATSSKQTWMTASSRALMPKSHWTAMVTIIKALCAEFWELHSQTTITVGLPPYTHLPAPPHYRYIHSVCTQSRRTFNILCVNERMNKLAINRLWDRGFACVGNRYQHLYFQWRESFYPNYRQIGNCCMFSLFTDLFVDKSFTNYCLTAWNS